MIKKYFIFFCFVFLIGFASSVSLTMGPSQLDFIGKSGEIICQNATLKSEGSEVVTGKVLFSEKGYSKRKLSKHNLSAEEVGLEANFPKEVLIDGETTVEVCVKGKSGNYHGIILYKIKDKPIQVGIWMNVSLSKGSKNSLMKITGDSVSVNGTGFGLVIIPLVLFAVLGLLVLRLKMKDKAVVRELETVDFIDY